VCIVVIGQVFDGNVDSYQVKHAYLDEPIIARYIKFHTVSWNRHPSMRVEIIGCQGQFTQLRPNFTGPVPRNSLVANFTRKSPTSYGLVTRKSGVSPACYEEVTRNSSQWNLVP